MKAKALFVGIFGLLIAACSASTPVALPVMVEGTAMLPALNDGDRILIIRNPPSLERGNIVVFYYPEDHSKSYIKRVVGLPGEEIEILNGKVLVNDKEIVETYVATKNSLSARSFAKLKLPTGSYFVMGDNRDSSNDSRFFGPVERSLIYGKFVGKYYENK